MRSCLEVNIKTLKKNIETLFQYAKSESCFFCPVIKANAYGHGAFAVIQTISRMNIKRIAVTSLEEAVQFKKQFPDMEIYILGPFDTADIPVINQYNIIPIVGQWQNLKDLTQSKRKSVPFHLKFNIGMNRFGFHPDEMKEVLKYIEQHSVLQLMGVAGHLSKGEYIIVESSAVQQVKAFKKICEFFNKSFSLRKLNNHLLNSSGWFALWSHSECDLSLGFRPGICLYGIKPPVEFSSQEAEKKYHEFPLQPAACLKSFVVHSYKLPAGESISYSGVYTTKIDSVLAVVSMGYADGLPYRLFAKGEVLFRGQRAPIAGHICLDFFIIDVTKIVSKEGKCSGEVKKGEEVVIFGRQKDHFISIEEQAEKAQSVPEEFLTCLSPRVQRVYK